MWAGRCPVALPFNQASSTWIFTGERGGVPGFFVLSPNRRILEKGRLPAWFLSHWLLAGGADCQEEMPGLLMLYYVADDLFVPRMAFVFDLGLSLNTWQR